MDSRNKGKAGELEAAERLRQLLSDPSIKRHLEQPRTGGECDLHGEKLRHFHTEVKRAQTPSLMAWFDKIRAGNELVREYPIPLIMWRPNMEQWRYFVELEELQAMQYIRYINAIAHDYGED